MPASMRSALKGCRPRPLKVKRRSLNSVRYSCQSRAEQSFISHSQLLCALVALAFADPAELLVAEMVDVVPTCKHMAMQGRWSNRAASIVKDMTKKDAAQNVMQLSYLHVPAVHAL